MHITTKLIAIDGDGENVNAGKTALNCLFPVLPKPERVDDTLNFTLERTEYVSPAWAMNIARDLRALNCYREFRYYYGDTEEAKRSFEQFLGITEKEVIVKYTSNNWHKHINNTYTDGRCEFNSQYTMCRDHKVIKGGNTYKIGQSVSGSSVIIPSFNLFAEFTNMHPGIIFTMKSTFNPSNVINDDSFMCNEIIRENIKEMKTKLNLEEEQIMRGADYRYGGGASEVVDSLIRNFGIDCQVEVSCVMRNGFVYNENFKIIEGNSRVTERHGRTRVPENPWNALPEHVLVQDNGLVLNQPEGAGPQREVNYSETARGGAATRPIQIQAESEGDRVHGMFDIESPQEILIRIMSNYESIALDL